MDIGPTPTPFLSCNICTKCTPISRLYATRLKIYDIFNVYLLLKLNAHFIIYDVTAVIVKQPLHCHLTYLKRAFIMEIHCWGLCYTYNQHSRAHRIIYV